MSNYASHPNFQSYCQIARSIARRTCQNIIYSEDDIYQELMLKLIQEWEYIHSWTEDPRGPFGLVKKVLTNRATDIVAYCAQRADTSVYAKESVHREEDEESFGSYNPDEEGEQLSDSSRFDTPEETLRGKELLNLFRELRDSQSREDVREFLDTIIEEEGRERIEDLNEKFEASSAKADKRSYLTPFRRAKLLGKASSFPYKIMFLVRDFLREKNIPMPREIANFS